jgi:hypothetical protein
MDTVNFGNWAGLAHGNGYLAVAGFDLIAQDSPVIAH